MAKRPSRIELLELDIDLTACRPLGRGVRRGRMEPRGRRRLPAGRLREGLLRRPDRGRAGEPLPRSRLPHPGSPARGYPRVSPDWPVNSEAWQERRNPVRLVVALSIAAVLAVFLIWTSLAGGTPVAPAEPARRARRRGRPRRASSSGRSRATRAARGARVHAARHRGLERPSRSSTRDRCPTSSRSAARST